MYPRWERHLGLAAVDRMGLGCALNSSIVRGRIDVYMSTYIYKYTYECVYKDIMKTSTYICIHTYVCTYIHTWMGCMSKTSSVECIDTDLHPFQAAPN